MEKLLSNNPRRRGVGAWGGVCVCVCVCVCVEGGGGGGVDLNLTSRSRKFFRFNQDRQRKLNFNQNYSKVLAKYNRKIVKMNYLSSVGMHMHFLVFTDI